MLFTSYIFIFIFLPVVLLGFYLLHRSQLRHLGLGWLVAASLFFYAWWNPVYLALLLCSLLFNYAVGRELIHRLDAGLLHRRILLTAGISINLTLLAYFKYSHFFIANVNDLLHTAWFTPEVILPLAISFFTFQQIAYLMDIYRGVSPAHEFIHYCLFVTFFPHLIAGPLVHHQEMLPQFAKTPTRRIKPHYIATGITLFFIGLFKKVLIADSVAPFANMVFHAAADGETLTFIEAWGGALAYAYQLYFDFSGYSDMAVGLALLFGIRLPLNFYSPYKARNIIDFWARWHMSLSRFLFSYLYLPLGGNRHGRLRQYLNLMTVMCLGGLWHGASWGFVIWGSLHGVFLMINHAWQSLCSACHQLQFNSPLSRFLSRAFTFIAVIAAWVFFRAEDLSSAVSILKGMLGLNGVVVWKSYFTSLNHLGHLGDSLVQWGVRFEEPTYFTGKIEILWLLSLSAIVWFAPNTHQLMAKYKTSINIYRGKYPERPIRFLQWRPTLGWGIAVGLLTLIALLHLSSAHEFLYFRF